MKSIIKFLIVCFIVMVQKSNYAQSVKIGEQWPDLVFKSLLNYQKTEMRLSDFKDKLIIIHFWSHSCPPCIREFPKLEELQKELDGKVQIILINGESKELTEAFFEKRKKIKKPDLLMAMGEKTIFNMFRMTGNIWLDGNRVLRYSTAPYNTNSKYINAFLSGKVLAITQQRKIEDFNPNVPLIAEGNGRWLTGINQYSYFFKSPVRIIESNTIIPGIDEKKKNRLYLNHITLLALVKYAFNENKKFDFDFILEVKDSSRFYSPKDPLLKDQWDAENHYSYDLLVPEDKADKLYEFMRQDIERYFGVKGKIENRRIQCLVLELIDSGNRLVTKSSTTQKSDYRDTVIAFYNHPFTKLERYLSNIAQNFSKHPFKNEAGFTGNIDIVLNKEVIRSGDLQLMNRELNQYGLNLSEKISEKTVLIISDK